MSLGSVESGDIPGASTMLSEGEVSGEMGVGFRSVASVASVLESQDLAAMSSLLDAKTVALLKDPSRAWMINTLQVLYVCVCGGGGGGGGG